MADAHNQQQQQQAAPASTNIDSMSHDEVKRYAKALKRRIGAMGGALRRMELEGGVRNMPVTPVQNRVAAHEPSTYDIREFHRAMNAFLREKGSEELLERAAKMARISASPMVTSLCEDGDQLDEAIRAVDETAKEMRERAGEVECGICYTQLVPGAVFKPTWCNHVICLTCINTLKQNHHGAVVPCPQRCEGNMCSAAYWTKHQKALDELAEEASSARPESTETSLEKVERWLREERIKIVTCGQGRFELAVDGPQANKIIGGTDEKMNVFRAKDDLKQIPDRFFWDKDGTTCGVPKSWYRQRPCP